VSWGVLILFATAGAATAPVAASLLRRAGAPIPLTVAAGLAALGLAAVCSRWQSGGWPGWWLPVPCVLTAFAVPLALADLRHLRLPDVLTLPAYPAFAAAVTVAALAGGGEAMAVRAALGAVLFGGAHALVRLAAPGSLGAGDVKLSGSLGGVLAAAGWPALPGAAVAAAAFSALLAVFARLGRSARDGVPHGLSLLLATWLCVMFPLPR
jgi:leader peptidase (prepilin peptidase)/N-methyltransferase